MANVEIPKIYKARLIAKSGTAEEWAMAENTFKPLKGEPIFYFTEMGPRFKVGNGIDYLKDLKFNEGGQLTDEDKQDIADLVLAGLDKWQGGSF